MFESYVTYGAELILYEWTWTRVFKLRRLRIGNAAADLIRLSGIRDEAIFCKMTFILNDLKTQLMAELVTSK